MAYTKGPWRVDDEGDRFSIIASDLKGCTRFGVVGEWDVAVIDGDDTFIGAVEADANATLISAAPELLEAAERLRDAYHAWRQTGYPQEGQTADDFSQALADQRAAIAKARGEQS